MGDLKLFRIDEQNLVEVEGYTERVERSLQNRFEHNLEALLAVRFLASEYVTSNGGRMDTLGIDENNCPVIIEYKRKSDENVINQGLFYLDWLMDHRGDFEILVRDRFGKECASQIEWSSPRLICVAADFTKYDTYAVNQMGRNIELYRYKNFGEDILLLDRLTEAVTSPKASRTEIAELGQKSDVHVYYKTTSEYLADADDNLRELYQGIENYILAIGDDITQKILKFYVAYKRIKNFVCMEIRPNAGKVLLYLKLDPKSFDEMPEFARDVKNIGHYGTGDLELTIDTHETFDQAKALILRAYNES